MAGGFVSLRRLKNCRCTYYKRLSDCVVANIVEWKDYDVTSICVFLTGYSWVYAMNNCGPFNFRVCYYFQLNIVLNCCFSNKLERNILGFLSANAIFCQFSEKFLWSMRHWQIHVFIATSSCKLIFVMFLVVLFVQKIEKLISLHKLFCEAKFSISVFKD